MKCIKYDGQWLVPPAFENLGGKRSCRKWKATIFHENKPLQHWFEVPSFDPFCRQIHSEKTHCLITLLSLSQEGYLTAPSFKRRSAQIPKVSERSEFCISFLVQKKTGPYISEGSSEGQLGHLAQTAVLFILKSTNTEGLLTVCIFSQRRRIPRTRLTEMKVSYQAVKNQREKWMKAAPRLRTTPMLKTPYRTQAESSRTKWRMSESVSAAANQGDAPRRKSLSTYLSELRAKPVTTCDRRKVRVVQKVRRRMTLCSKEKVELGVTTLLSLSCLYVFSRKRLIFP